MSDFTRDEQKSILKEAFREWLDEKFLAFGKWTAKGIGTAIFGYVLYFIATHGGWK